MSLSLCFSVPLSLLLGVSVSLLLSSSLSSVFLYFSWPLCESLPLSLSLSLSSHLSVSSVSPFCLNLFWPLCRSLLGSPSLSQSLFPPFAIFLSASQCVSLLSPLTCLLHALGELVPSKEWTVSHQPRSRGGSSGAGGVTPKPLSCPRMALLLLTPHRRACVVCVFRGWSSLGLVWWAWGAGCRSASSSEAQADVEGLGPWLGAVWSVPCLSGVRRSRVTGPGDITGQLLPW